MSSSAEWSICKDLRKQNDGEANEDEGMLSQLAPHKIVHATD